MLIEEEFVIDADRPLVAAFLIDADKVSACVPGVQQVEATGVDSYSATLAIRVGPIKTKFAGAVELDRSEIPERLAASIVGKDRTSGTSVNVQFTASLAEAMGEDGPRTIVSTVADVALRGRLAQFGSGVIKATASEMVREFATAVNEHLTPVTTPAADHAPGPAMGAPQGSPMRAPTPPHASSSARAPMSRRGDLTLGRLIRMWLRHRFRPSHRARG